jgi:hypothetical protein
MPAPAPHPPPRKKRKHPPVQVPHGDEDVGAGGHAVAGQLVVGQRAADEHGGLGVEAHALGDDAGAVAQLPHLLKAGLAVAQHAVNLRGEQAGQARGGWVGSGGQGRGGGGRAGQGGGELAGGLKKIRG